MWREYLYFTRKQRMGIWILILLITVALVTGTILSERSAHLAVLDTEQLEKEYIEFMTGLREKSPETAYTSKHTPERNFVLFAFDPNRIDSVSLTRLGLPGWMARNVIRYREKGGQFRDAESFRKIYGMTDELYDQLTPYIRIERESTPSDTEADVMQQALPEQVNIPEYTPAIKYPEGTVVDINQVDTTELKMIPGIGSGIARRIVSYRQQLGGFHSTKQLLEIEYTDTDMLVWFTVGSDTLKKIPVNRASVERLRTHPYLNFYQSRAIVEYRRKRGKIKDIQELKLYEEFTPEDLERIAPYLSYE